jgi:FAD/FMN-containing dehydrogenase
MATEQITTTGNNRAPLSDEIIEALAATLRGPVLGPNDPGYDDVRRVWNGMIDRYPAVIARCAGTADVVACVDFARERGLSLSVRGGGHNVAGNAVRDGALMIDLSLMKGVHVDPLNRSARAAAGVTWGEFDRETQLFGLATPGGEVTTTGIAGFTLGGGMGVIRRRWGLTCDNLLSAEVVTADGRVLTASDTQNPDLFWAIRGGGGNFGVVTSFEFQLHPLGPEIFGFVRIYPLDDGPTVMRAWRDFAAIAPDEISCDVLIWSLPELPGLPDEMVGMPVIAVWGSYSGPAENGPDAFAPLSTTLHEPLLDLTGVSPYVESQSQLDSFFPDGGQYYWKALSIDELGDDAIDVILKHAATRPSPNTPIAIRHLGGAIARIPEDATAFANRDAQFNVSFDSAWEDPNDTERNVAWTRAAWEELRDLSGGGIYVNFAGLGEDGDTLARLAYRDNYARLEEVKRRYDPTNLFRGNINITP